MEDFKTAKKAYAERNMIRVNTIIDEGEFLFAPNDSIDVVADNLEFMAALLRKQNNNVKVDLIQRLAASLINAVGVHQEETRKKAEIEYQKSIGGTGGSN